MASAHSHGHPTPDALAFRVSGCDFTAPDLANLFGLGVWGVDTHFVAWALGFQGPGSVEYRDFQVGEECADCRAQHRFIWASATFECATQS